MESINQEAIKQDELHPFAMLIKVFIGWVLMAAIMYLSAGMPSNESNFEHIEKDMGMSFLLAISFWCLIFGFYDRLNERRMTDRLGIVIMAFSLGHYTILMFSPSALEHRDHALSYDLAKPILADIYQRDKISHETLSSTAVKDVTANLRDWDLLVEHNQLMPKRANCIYIDNNMTVKELDSYIKTFEPHCVDAEFGLK